MGVGEGFLNLPNVLKSVRILNAEWGLQIGARRITLSTVGVPGTIDKLIASGLQVNLAISLHAPTDELRAQLIPYRNLMTVEDLMNAAEDYYEFTGREATFEYVLLAGVNDSPELGKALAKRIRAVHATVNLIPYNEVEGAAFQRPSMNAVKEFRHALESRGINVTLRRRHGSGVLAACGQLRRDATG
jgi:23S rRNA (adenine2503-C2)-methyltransferase